MILCIFGSSFYSFCSTSQFNTMKMISWSGDTSIAHFGEITLVARDQSLAIKFLSARLMTYFFIFFVGIIDLFSIILALVSFLYACRRIICPVDLLVMLHWLSHKHDADGEGRLLAVKPCNFSIHLHFSWYDFVHRLNQRLIFAIHMMNTYCCS